jgi:hypothetical protein
MIYTIKFDDCSNLWIMNGNAYRFVGEHLYDIAKENNLTTTANSESHHLQILRGSGLEIELLEEDGSKVIW